MKASLYWDYFPSQPVGGRRVCEEELVFESLRKKRAGNVVTGQQQQFSHYRVSMAAGEERQHNSTLQHYNELRQHPHIHTYIRTSLHG